MNPEDKRKRLQKRHADGADDVIAMMEVTQWSSKYDVYLKTFT